MKVSKYSTALGTFSTNYNTKAKAEQIYRREISKSKRGVVMYTSVIEPIGVLRVVIKPKCHYCGKPYYLVAEHLDKADGHLCVRCERKLKGG